MDAGPQSRDQGIHVKDTQTGQEQDAEMQERIAQLEQRWQKRLQQMRESLLKEMHDTLAGVPQHHHADLWKARDDHARDVRHYHKEFQHLSIDLAAEIDARQKAQKLTNTAVFPMENALRSGFVLVEKQARDELCGNEEEEEQGDQEQQQSGSKRKGKERAIE